MREQDSIVLLLKNRRQQQDLSSDRCVLEFIASISADQISRQGFQSLLLIKIRFGGVEPGACGGGESVTIGQRQCSQQTETKSQLLGVDQTLFRFWQSAMIEGWRTLERPGGEMVLLALAAMFKDWMTEGETEKTAEAAVRGYVAGYVAGSVVGTVGMASEGSDGRGVEASRPECALWFYKEMNVNIQCKMWSSLSLFAVTTASRFIPQYICFSVTELGLVSILPPFQDSSKFSILVDDLTEVPGTGGLDVDPLQRLFGFVTILLGPISVLAVAGTLEMVTGTYECCLSWEIP
jgi:hypothetical protein